MPVIWIVIIIASAVIFPRLTAVFFVGPVLGFTIGTFAWAIAALFDSSLVNLNVWLSFMGVTAVGATLFALSDIK